MNCLEICFFFNISLRFEKIKQNKLTNNLKKIILIQKLLFCISKIFVLTLRFKNLTFTVLNLIKSDIDKMMN
jgi:hypothetical protein